MDMSAGQVAVILLRGWEGNRRSGVAVAMRLWAHGLRKKETGARRLHFCRSMTSFQDATNIVRARRRAAVIKTPIILVDLIILIPIRPA